jgi:hypothetical protein
MRWTTRREAKGQVNRHSNQGRERSAGDGIIEKDRH